MSETCLNEKCGYFTSGEVCTKCGKSQSYLRLQAENAALRSEVETERRNLGRYKDRLAETEVERNREKHKAERYREALEKIRDYKCGCDAYCRHDLNNEAKLALAEEPA